MCEHLSHEQPVVHVSAEVVVYVIRVPQSFLDIVIFQFNTGKLFAHSGQKIEWLIVKLSDSNITSSQSKENLQPQ